MTGMLFVNGYSQNSFFSSSSAFTINHWCQSGPCGISSYHFAYDTILNGKIHHRFDDWGSVPGHVYLRESNDSVFCYGPTCNSDLLLYVFGLQVGDTFLLYNGGFPCTNTEWFVADTVSAVTLMTGLSVPYIHLSNGNRELRWMYHVGDVNYGFFESSLVEGFDQFVCASDFSGTLWLSSQFSVAVLCDSLSEIPEIQKDKSDVIVFPVPTGSTVTIKWNPKMNFDQLLIRSTTGGVLKVMEVKGIQIDVDLSLFPEGFYCYILSSKDGNYESGRLVLSR